MKQDQYMYIDSKKPPEATLQIKVSDFGRLIEEEEDPDTSWLDEPENLGQRAAFDRGDLVFVGVRACVTLHLPAGQSGNPEFPFMSVIHVVQSPGHWGLESYGRRPIEGADFDEAFEEQSEVLIQMLRALGTITVVPKEQPKGTT